MPHSNRTRFTLFILVPLLLAGCSSKMSEAERQKIAVAYGEMLLAQQMYPGDPALAKRAADSSVRAHGFDNEADLMESVKEVAGDPESLRMMLDSAQKRLERIQQGLNPDSVKPATPAPKK